jgi:hypothetical protein
VEYPVLTAETASNRTTDTYSLIDLLQAEEDSMIHNFGRSGRKTALFVK